MPGAPPRHPLWAPKLTSGASTFVIAEAVAKETPRRDCCLHLRFLFFFCAFSIRAFRAFFEAISALS
jgi:hypothetical protein